VFGFWLAAACVGQSAHIESSLKTKPSLSFPYFNRICLLFGIVCGNKQSFVNSPELNSGTFHHTHSLFALWCSLVESGFGVEDKTIKKEQKWQ
ncbi:hypothetical protein VU08_00090, partial [Desulfobulbus sp. F5]|nr:hypothetical protein [Desulfobulbus sp. F5]